MDADGTKRKLTAILIADVKGYSRLMEDNEEDTVRTVTAYRDFMTGLIQKQNGRVVDAKGDNLLAEFPSVVDAVRCAVEIQKEIRVKNSDLPENRKMEWRIGINLGDVITEGDTIYGDGVNIAARLEGLAEGGGICISGTAFDQVKNKLDLGFENLGKHAVKNISEPVRLYRVLMEPESSGSLIYKRRKDDPRHRRRATFISLFILIAAIAVFATWYFYQRKDIEPASIEKMSFSLPDRPSIAVLPFKNLSGDREQESLADGITENIITSLSKTPKMFVIASNSVFTYKGKSVKVQQVAEEMGVRYVLEGSLQKTGDRLRINAQLIDAIEGHHLWADRYDRNLKDIFALQDDITKELLTALQVKLTTGEQARVNGKGTDNLEAYLKLLQGREHYRRGTKEDNILAKRIFEEVIALDPKYAIAYRFLSGTYHADLAFGTRVTQTVYFQGYRIGEKGYRH